MNESDIVRDHFVQEPTPEITPYELELRDTSILQELLDRMALLRKKETVNYTGFASTDEASSAPIDLSTDAQTLKETSVEWKIPTVETPEEIVLSSDFESRERVNALINIPVEIPSPNTEESSAYPRLEIIQRVITGYTLAPITSTKDFLIELIQQQDIFFVGDRLDIIERLLDLSFRINTDLILSLYDYCYHDPLFSTMSLPQQWRHLYRFYTINKSSEETLYDCLSYLVQLINHSPYKNYIRYRYLIQCDDPQLRDILLVEFRNCASNSLKYRLLTNQLSFDKNWLINVATDTSLEENSRADACDMLLQHDETKELGLELLDKMGRSGKGPVNVYQHSQNVHSGSIVESAKEILDSVLKDADGAIDVSSLFEDLQTKYPTTFHRIECDRTPLYFNGRQYFLLDLFNSILRIIVSTDDLDKHALYIVRMEDELVDMSGTCTSGFWTRFANIFSDETRSVRISWADQIKANLFAKFYAFLYSEPDRDDILEEFTDKQRRLWIKFYGEHLDNIRLEMLEEFLPFIERDDFAEAFLLAVRDFCW